MWTQTQLAYLAGILDGEGSIYIQSRNRNNSINYFPRFQIVNTNKELLDWVKEIFGGIVYEKPRKHLNPNWRMQYEWFSTREQIDQILPLIIPFLIIKKKHAEVMLEFRKTFLNKKSFKISKEINEFRKDCLTQLKALNKRGNF